MQINNKKKIFLTFDLDPDYSFIKKNRPKDTWLGIEFGVRKIMDELFKHFKKKIKTTWFIRIDQEIENKYGEMNYIYNKYENIFRHIYKNSGVVGIHPHLVKKNKTGDWVLEKNEQLNVDHLQKILNSAKKLKYLDKDIFRIGGSHFSKKIFNFMLKNNIKVDSTSFPCRDDFVWKDFPKFPHYFEKKHKIPNKFYDRSKSIIEVPVTIFDVKADYDRQEYVRYFDLTFKSIIFKKALSTLNTNSKFFVSLSHPGNLVEKLKIKHGLLSFGTKNYMTNLKLFIKKLKLRGYKYEFEDLRYFKYKKNLN